MNYELVPEDKTGTAPSGIPFRLSDHGNVLEKEPNNSIKEATPAELPLAFNGILEKPGDIDFFRFKAKKGETYEVECYGRRIRSAIDPVMVLYNAAGQGITSNDDSRGPDPYFRFTVPADGDYCLSITDHLQRGGPGFVYRVEFQPVEPKITTGLPQVARYSQLRQQIYVARGNRFGAQMSASRENFGGELVLDPKGMPKGVKIIADPMPANASTMPVVFEAAADAPLAGSLVDFQARLNDPKQKISGGFFNHAEFVIAAPGQSLFSWCDVDRMAVVVVEELPYTLEIVEPKVPLVQGGSMNLKIRAHRKKGFTEPINVQIPFLPPGVGQRAGRRHSQGAERSPVSAQRQRRGRGEKVEDLRPRLGQRERGGLRVVAVGESRDRSALFAVQHAAGGGRTGTADRTRVQRDGE